MLIILHAHKYVTDPLNLEDITKDFSSEQKIDFSIYRVCVLLLFSENSSLIRNTIKTAACIFLGICPPLSGTDPGMKKGGHIVACRRQRA